MSSIDKNNKRGFANSFGGTSDFNAQNFHIKQEINKINTSFLARVDSCTSTGSAAGAGTVNATPLSTQIDGENNAVDPVSIPVLPHCRYQFGIAAIVIDPVPGDICLFNSCKYDISTVQARTTEPQRPGSFRRFDQSDSVLAGAVHTQKPEVWIELKQDKTILIHGPAGITIETDADCVITVGGNLSATVQGNTTLVTNGNLDSTVNGNVTAKIGGSLTANVSGNSNITCPNTTLNGNLKVNGHISGTGGLSISGGSGASVQGSLTTTGDVKAGSISLQGHTHGGVEGGSSSTGGPQ